LKQKRKKIGQIDFVKAKKNAKLLPLAVVTIVTKHPGTWKILFRIVNAIAV
jgi:hypothetical protein